MGINESKNTISSNEISDTESDSEYFLTDMEYQSDAVFANILPIGKTLTVNNVRDIQNSLDEYEVVTIFRGLNIYYY